jgi:DNA-directed RNA polymerase subunit RPC12/RpoP
VFQTIVGLLMVALTAACFYWIGRRRYKCPYCGRIVKYDDVNCPYCGDDMKFRHRAGPESIPHAARNIGPPKRRFSDGPTRRS